MSNLIFVDMVTSVTAVIRHPPQEVWPWLLDQAAWMLELKIETVAGERGCEGELKRVCAVPGEPEFPHFYFKTLLLAPPRRFVYKAFSETRSGSWSFTGVEILSLTALGGDSAVSFEAYLEVQSATMPIEELEGFVEEAKRDGAAMWQRNFERLAFVVDVEKKRSTS